MWRAITDAVGRDARDSLWDYPDLMPAPADVDDPSALIARLQARARGEAPERDEMDDALDALLAFLFRLPSWHTVSRLLGRMERNAPSAPLRRGRRMGIEFESGRNDHGDP